MFNNRKTLKFKIVLISFFFLYLSISKVIYAESEFTNASLQGRYSLIGSVGAYEAVAVGTYVSDGISNSVGSGIFNVPIPIRKRAVMAFTFDSTFSVNPDGTGTGIATVTFDDGTGFGSELDFVITNAEIQEDGVKLALELFCVTRELAPIPGGGVLKVKSKRLPD